MASNWLPLSEMINYKYVISLLKIIPRNSKLESLTITSPRFLDVNPVL